MKRLLTVVVLSLLIFMPSSFSKTIGEGNLKLNDKMIKYFQQYLLGKGNQRPMVFTIAVDGSYGTYWYCPVGQCGGDNPSQFNRICEKDGGVECKIFAKGKYIKWKNGINKGKGKSSKVSGRVSFDELKSRLTELGFVNDGSSKNISNSNNSSNVESSNSETKKVAKKYNLDGDRSIALSWEGYDSLIAGSVSFNEADYKGTLILSLPNGDGECNGSYSLQKDGKGTWQIGCTNNMGAAGTLKWNEINGVIGSGRDHNDKKVKFTVAGKS
jgi:hypothetical protein